MDYDQVENRYVNGEYLSKHSTWHIEHSQRKAQELRSVIPHGYLEKIFNGDSKHVVEIGCGVGGVLSSFAKTLRDESFDNEPIGYDISPDAIRMAKERFGDSVKFVNSVESADVEKASLLLLIDVLEHMVNPTEFLRSVKDRSRYLIIRLPLDKSLWNVVFGKLPKLKEELGHLHYYDYKAALALLHESGFKVMNYNFVNNFSDETNRRSLVSKIIYPVRAFTSMLSPSVNSRLFGGNSIVIFAEAK